LKFNLMFIRTSELPGSFLAGEQSTFTGEGLCRASKCSFSAGYSGFKTDGTAERRPGRQVASAFVRPSSVRPHVGRVSVLKQRAGRPGPGSSPTTFLWREGRSRNTVRGVLHAFARVHPLASLM
jgi:hypothetical protein